MRSPTRSWSDKHRDSVFTISKAEVLSVTVVGAVIAFINCLIIYFFGSTTLPADIVEQKEQLLDNIFFFQDTQLFTRLSSILFWFVVGSILYLLGWFIVVFLVDGYNDVVISNSFKHPNSFSQSDFWLAIVGRGLTRIAAATILLFTGISVVRFVARWYRWELSHFGAGSLSARYVATHFAVTIGLALCVYYVFVVGTRLLFLKRRVIS